MRFEKFFVPLHKICVTMPRGCYITATRVKHHAEERCSGCCFSSAGVSVNDGTTVYFY